MRHTIKMVTYSSSKVDSNIAENGHILGLSSSYYTKVSVTWYNVLLQNFPNIIDSAGSDIDKYEPEM